MKNCPLKELPNWSIQNDAANDSKTLQARWLGLTRLCRNNFEHNSEAKESRIICWNHSPKFLRLFVLYKNFAKTMGFPQKTPAQVPHFFDQVWLQKHGFQQFQFYNIVSCLLGLFPFTLVINTKLSSVVFYLFLC